ncbi:hypothetical protein RB195_005539 [Necator americanus]|nr:hypothetical protein NECAME_15268 [Necator americanus]ETN69497.1 hypothetical protein NECAME_15268 [Necator americanus]
MLVLLILCHLSTTSLSEEYYDVHYCDIMGYLDSKIKKPLQKAIKARVNATLLSYDCFLEDAAGADFINSKQHLSWDSIRPPVLRDAEEQRYEEVAGGVPLFYADDTVILEFVERAAKEWEEYLKTLKLTHYYGCNYDNRMKDGTYKDILVCLFSK